MNEDQDIDAEDDNAGSQLSESFAQMDTEDQGEQDSSSVSNSEVTTQQATNTAIESQTVPTQRQIEMMKSEPNSSSHVDFNPYEFTPPVPEPEVSAGSEEEDIHLRKTSGVSVNPQELCGRHNSTETQLLPQLGAYLCAIMI